MRQQGESWQQERQRIRDETRRLENIRFWASIVFSTIGFALLGALMFWASAYASTEILGPWV